MPENQPTTPVKYVPVPGWPGYRVGDNGTVWSCRTRQGIADETRWRIRKPTMKHDGYLRVILFERGRKQEFMLHRLVLLCFVGPCPEGMEACHGPDHDRTNCRPENLRWDTPEANFRDRDNQNRTAKGSRIGNSKLKEDDIPVIRQLHKEGLGCQRISKRYNVRRSTIEWILNGRTWSHIQ